MSTELQSEQIEEKEVLRLLALGYSNKEIAAQFKADVETIADLKADAMKRLGLKGRIDIVRYIEKQKKLGGGVRPVNR